MKALLQLGLAGPDIVAVAKAMIAAGLAPSTTPASLSIDGNRRKPSADWLESSVAKCRTYVMAGWGGDAWLRVDPRYIVKASAPDYDLEPDRVLAQLAKIPFTVGSTPSLYPAWDDGTLGESYQAPGFGDLHWSHGWACFFRGAGHDRLVSRRWLDYGPWRLLRGEQDTSLVQFHDLAADAATALAQAKPGHERMGISDIGGYIQSNYAPSADIRGTYHPGQHKLEFVVHGREVSQVEMLDACAARYYQALGRDKPLRRIAYVFMEESVARAHLHELWLRELECWAIIAGREVRLDEDYRPARSLPAWVAALG